MTGTEQSTEQKTIFVSVVSYRDTECAPSIRDLFKKAAHPERITVGAVVQYVPGVDDPKLEIPGHQSQVRVMTLEAEHSRGTCYARHLAQCLWAGEDYYLQIDSHARFIENWDVVVFEELARCPSPKPILSTLCMEYRPPDEIPKSWATVMIPKYFDKGMLPVYNGALHKDEFLPEPQYTGFLCGHFAFGPGAMVSECRYDPYLYFYGEETSLNCRYWTWGWDIYAPTRSIVFHGYSVRNRHWADHKEWWRLDQRAYRRVRHLVGIEQCDDPATLVELEHYGLGTARPLSDYEKKTGIYFKEQAIRL